jgi:hypothetical protein
MMVIIQSEPVVFIRLRRANMGEVVQFVPKSERERLRLIREARAIYDSIFPPADPISEHGGKAPMKHAAGGFAHGSDGGRPS